MEKRARLYICFFLLPSVIYLLIWRVIPLFYTLYLSFTRYNLIRHSSPIFIGLTNYKECLSDPIFLHSLKLTFIFTIGATFIELIIGLGIALLFDRQLKAKQLLIGITIMPMTLTPVVVGIIWYILYHDMIGPINYILRVIGIKPLAWTVSTSTALISVMIADIWEWTSFVFLLLFSGLQSIPVETYEAGKVDGANNYQLFRYITLPSLLDLIFITAILRAMDAFRVFDTVYTLTGGGPGIATDVISIRIYKAAFISFEMGYSAAMVIISLFIISVLFSTYLKLVRV